MRPQYFMLAIAIVFLSFSSSIPLSFASSVSFSIESNASEVELGEEFEITITGHEVEDLYGFELELEFDTSKLKFIEASSGISNMIYPIDTVENRSFLLVSTKVGDVQGESGEIVMSNITFQAIDESDEVEIKLNQVKLANSDTDTARHEVNELVEVQLIKEEEDGEGPEEEPEEKPTITLTDISGHWAENNILRAVELGFIHGYEDGTFLPNREVTRAEFAVMFHLAFGYEEDSDAWQSFVDRDEIAPWSRTAISALVAEGIIAGYEDGTFRSGRSVIRSEMAVMMAAMLNLDVNPTNRSAFSDEDAMPQWAEPSIAAVAQEGLLQGRGNNMFHPNGLMTRAEAVQVVITMIDYLDDATE